MQSKGGRALARPPGALIRLLNQVMGAFRSVSSARSDEEALVDAAAGVAVLSLVAVRAFLPSVASAAGAAVPIFLVLEHLTSAASCADAHDPASVEVSAVPVPASGTSCLAAVVAAAPPSNSQNSAADPGGSPLASHLDERNSAGSGYSPRGSRLADDLHCSRVGSGCSPHDFRSFYRDSAADCIGRLAWLAPRLLR